MMYEISIKIPGKKGHPLAKMSISESDLRDIYDRADGERDECVIMESIAELIEDSGIVKKRVDVQVTIDLTMMMNPDDNEDAAITNVRRKISDSIFGMDEVHDLNFITAKPA